MIPLSGVIGPLKPSRELLHGMNAYNVYEPFHITSLLQLTKKNVTNRTQMFYTPIQEENVAYEMLNMVQKRKRKMNKHKHRKRLKRDRFWRRKHKK